MKTKVSLIALVVITMAIVALSCKKNSNDMASDVALSPDPILPAHPDDYAVSTNDHLAALGRVLFYDKSLSLNNSVSCASCHQQARAFCDNQRFSVGLEDLKTPRNSPTIFAKNGRVFWDGRVFSLTDLALRPIKNHVEMKFENLQALSDKLAGINYYTPLFKKAFPQKNTIDSTMIQQALGEFLRNFNFSNNKFSRSLRNKEMLTASEKLGKQVFFNEGRCSKCHHIEGTVFIPSNDSITPGGYGPTNEHHNIGLDLVYKDKGVGEVFHNPSLDGNFMTPVLLNVEYTAPYMHDGRFKTLEEVVEHYNGGIQNHPNLSFELKDVDITHMNEDEILEKFDTNHNSILENSEMSCIPPVKLGLTPSQKRGLVDFLKTLSDPAILRDPKFSNPFAMK